MARLVLRTLKLFTENHNLKGMMESNPEDVAKFFDAVKANDVEKTIELLKTKGINVNSVDKTSHGRTAVHIAAEKDYRDMMRVLVDDYKADLSVVDKTEIGQLPIQLACDNYNVKIAKFLAERNSPFTEYAKRFFNDELVDELFKAAEANDVPKVVELLTEKKVDVNSKDRGNYHRTILHIASTKGYEELVRVLVDDFNADINYEDQIGDSAKNMAVDFEHPNIVKFLKERNGDKTTSN